MANTPNLVPREMVHMEISEPGGPEVLVPRQVPVPQPKPGEILIRVAAAGINRPDVLQRKGQYPMPPGVTSIPGLEVAGDVVGLGEGASGFVLGDSVCALTEGGGYAEYCTVPATQALTLPAGLDPVRAAAVPETYFTVWANVFQLGRIAQGESILVHGGTSGIGSTAIALCREFGIRVLATDDGAEKCSILQAQGAERAIDFRNEDFAEVVREWSGGIGVNAVVDIVGGPYFERNIAALGKGGRLILIGFLGGEIAEKVNLLTIALKRLTVTGSTMRSRSAAEKAAIASELKTRVWPAIAAGRCIPNVHAVFPLERAADAHRLMERGSHVGKIVLRVGDRT